ncbi:MAG TPA: NrfD/PsrC family molybdoenzyme membrane anchor subunit [Syntrophomonadaceae bacterium]|nr:NrfD/PsrC family molybdoenzyme membrane anchor subunit [Syntrophomonadaceae bacterium]
MSQKHGTWDWMLAVDFFFSGMGAAMLLFAGIAEFVLENGYLSTIGIFAGAIFIMIGSGILIFELGRPFQSWRVFMKPTTLMSFGAWNMTIAIGAGILLGTTWINLFPWFGIIWIRKILALVCIITGFIVAAYPGLLLAMNKARPFWTGSGMVVIFFVSSLLTGLAGYMVCGLFGDASPVIYGIFPYVAAGLCFLQLVVWISYILSKTSGISDREAITTERWIKGNYAAPFKIGVLLIGTVVPFILFVVPNLIVVVIASLLTILGGLIMRNLVIYAGQDRTWLPGEIEYRSKLPHGDEAFLQKVWTKKI